jgi:gamma-glutamyltranspeptidase / glutathione hydrolase
VVLNDGTMWFDPVPGHVNSLAPGRRIMTAGSPLVMLRDGKPRLAMGAPGGRRVISAMVHCAVNMVDHGMGPQQAMNTSRCHSEGSTTEIEQGAGPEVIAGLQAMGHDLLVREETYSSSHFGRPNGILVDDDGALLGGVNVLKPAMAIGL